MERKIAALLFSDVAGYSKLTEAQLCTFIERVPRDVADLFERHRDRFLELNTWGDAIVAVSQDPYCLARIALDLRDLYRNRNWRDEHLPDDLICRIALHAGVIYIGYDPIRNSSGIVSTQVNLAARLEPVTTPGEVWVTDQFMKLIDPDTDPKLAFDNLGVRPLAKRFGSAHLWRLRRSYEPPDVPQDIQAQLTEEVQPPVQERYELPTVYDHFTGRDQELKQVMAALQEPERYRFIALYGLGGIGKTALACEAARLSLQQERFQQVVWVGAKIERFTGSGIEKLAVSDLTFDTLLNQVGLQCHLPNLAKLSIQERQQSIQALLATRPVLIVLDNLETAQDAETLVSRVSALLRGRSQALITSRHHVERTDVYAVQLGGMNQDEGTVFLREEGKSRGITAVVEAPHATLQEIHMVTGGAPLAMKLVVGQLSRRPLDVVLDYLKEVSLGGQDYDFYRFIFKHSWDMLSLEAKKILVSLSVFDPATGGPIDIVRQVSKVEKGAFFPAMDVLIKMSLVDFVGGLNCRQYVLHPLTYYFVLSDIVKKWE